MYDAEKLYPQEYHPALPDFTLDVSRLAPYISRTTAGGIKYYITDFGISRYFGGGEERLVKGKSCQDDSVPELSNEQPYDPFPVDIYTLGNVFRKDLMNVSLQLRVRRISDS